MTVHGPGCALYNTCVAAAVAERKAGGSMRRWSGGGNNHVEYPLPPGGAEFVEAAVGAGTAPADATLASSLAAVPISRAPDGAGLHQDPLERLLHARGQSLPDWIALRTGRIGAFPDAVAYPADTEEVAHLIRFAAERRLHLIPFGGGTSVVGHINPQPSEAPIVTVDL